MSDHKVFKEFLGIFPCGKPLIKEVKAYVLLCPKCKKPLSNGDYTPYFNSKKEAKEGISETNLECETLRCDYEYDGIGF
jgi:hypothetical protein